MGLVTLTPVRGSVTKPANWASLPSPAVRTPPPSPNNLPNSTGQVAQIKHVPLLFRVEAGSFTLIHRGIRSAPVACVYIVPVHPADLKELTA